MPPSDTSNCFDNLEYCRAVLDPSASSRTLRDALGKYPNMVSLEIQTNPKKMKAASQHWKTHTGQNRYKDDDDGAKKAKAKAKYQAYAKDNLEQWEEKEQEKAAGEETKEKEKKDGPEAAVAAADASKADASTKNEALTVGAKAMDVAARAMEVGNLAINAARDVSKVAAAALSQAGEAKAEAAAAKGTAVAAKADAAKALTQSDDAINKATKAEAEASDAKVTAANADANAAEAMETAARTERLITDYVKTQEKKERHAKLHGSPLPKFSLAKCDGTPVSEKPALALPTPIFGKPNDIPSGKPSAEPVKLTKGEMKEIRKYTKGSKIVNGNLRSGFVTPENSKNAIDEEVLQGALGKLPPYEGPVYRGVNFNQVQIDKLSTAETFFDNGFMSTSSLHFDEQKSHAFKSMNCRLFIQSKTGRDIRKFASSSYKDEYEVLFAPRTKFRVLSVKQVAKEKYDFEMEEI